MIARSVPGESIGIEHVVAHWGGREDFSVERFHERLGAADGAGHGDAGRADLEDVLGRRVPEKRG